MHQGVTKRGPAPLQAEKTSARGMHVQGVRPHLGTWCQAIRCGNGSCRWIVPMVVPFGAVSMDPDPRGFETARRSAGRGYHDSALAAERRSRLFHPIRIVARRRPRSVYPYSLAAAGLDLSALPMISARSPLYARALLSFFLSLHLVPIYLPSEEHTYPAEPCAPIPS